jgi:hypothetical protein
MHDAAREIQIAGRRRISEPQLDRKLRNSRIASAPRFAGTGGRSAQAATGKECVGAVPNHTIERILAGRANADPISPSLLLQRPRVVSEKGEIACETVRHREKEDSMVAVAPLIRLLDSGISRIRHGVDIICDLRCRESA